ncbi:hemolysin A [Sphaerochaeta pleomorpha str. Grapes]|uniref:Hemolysin A n=1 Tax=Sphaerochaeta pleomorpha (strain ATCC BAA-1885 / DSM 22778 / Grapes) TaxID=158190 RepID=G8QRL7_SPHPG|nr:TlyA family RNA methyltransferase [Sphaerochaeta pleomorpha]AEV29939.1 hemolysin A [Sphaerochaeta pleomorpha str. Grapes]
MKTKKLPLLQLLGRQYRQYTKDQLTAFIACRNVYANGTLATDPKQLLAVESELAFTFDKYVSRGGFKLEHALDAFQISVDGLVMLDAGSSTGGFTDCLLQRNARLVHSVDVGYNQLDWRLRTDKRVLVHEKQNIMFLENLEPACDAAVCDLSFRSIGGAASHILQLCTSKWLISLIKPQFELPKGQKGFSGVVEDKALLKEVMITVYRFLSDEQVGIHGLLKSPITGHKGNTEFLALLKPSQGMDILAYSARLDSLLS